MEKLLYNIKKDVITPTTKKSYSTNRTRIATRRIVNCRFKIILSFYTFLVSKRNTNPPLFKADTRGYIDPTPLD